jgi:hypothetical protein
VIDTTRTHRLPQAAFALLWTVPILATFYAVGKHTVAFPFWDEWYTPGAQLASWYRGTLTFADLVSQHNESRKLVPRLVYLPLFTIAGWDVRLILPLVFATVGGIAVGLHSLVRRTIHAPFAACVAFTAMVFLLFSPREYQNFTNGIQWETFFPGLALVLALLINLSTRSVARKAVCNALLALIATYTFANGMLLWLLAFPIRAGAATRSRSQLGSRIAYIIAGSASIVSYFVGYRHPPMSPPSASLVSDAPGLVHFFLIWIGSLLRVANPAVAGGVVLTAFVALAAIAAWLIIRGREWRPHYPWLVLGLYTLMSGAMTARARLGFGFEIATDNHYTVFTVMLYIAVTGLAFTIYEQLHRNRLVRRTAWILGTGTTVLVLALTISAFNAEWRFLKKSAAYRTHLALVFRWADAIPKNPELSWITPYPDTPEVIHILAEHNVLRPRPVSAELARTVNTVPASVSGDAGVLDQGSPDGNGRLLVKGSAHVPDEKRAAECVVIGLETASGWTPRWVIGTGNEKPGMFSRLVLAPNLEPGAMVRGWAIDLKRERAYPLSGAIRINP